jgi:hypothetical protein
MLIDVKPFVDVAVMGRHNNDGTPIGGLPQEAPQAAGIVKVLVSGGFVRHDIIRRVDERPGGRHPLPLTAGKGRYRLRGQIVGIESREHGQTAGAPVTRTAGARDQGQHHVFQHSQIADQMILLKDDADASAPAIPVGG